MHSLALFAILAVVLLIASPAVVADESTPALSTTPSADVEVSPTSAQETGSASPTVDETQVEPVEQTMPAGADRGSGVADEVAPGIMERSVSAYVAELVRAAVVDVDGNLAACVCAVAVSVSLDGPANAVAELGRSRDNTSVLRGGSGAARSGRSGDATALSVTGDGSASSSAVSGGTGSVVGGSSGSDAALNSADTPVRARSTTIDVAGITSSLRTLVGVLGDEMGALAGADTSAHMSGLLEGARPDLVEPSEPVSIEVAAWDGSSDSRTDTIRCPAYDGSSSSPRCALAVAVTGGTVSNATVLSSRTSSSGAADLRHAGVPGMATSISVAVSGAAVSSARTGDAGVRVPRGALVEHGTASSTASPRSGSFAMSGDSGTSIAVALTVRGASATSARSGDTGSAVSAVGPADAASPLTSGGARPGAGGVAQSIARSGGSGRSVALSNGGDGASGESRSGDTGDASAVAADGVAGRDWSAGPGDSTRVVGGRGGDGAALAVTGHSGATLSLVISGGSAVASATSGPTGASTATSTGGKGGDTHATGSGSDVVTSGGGGSASSDGRSGDTGDSTSVLVTPYDGTGASRSGRSGGVRSFATGGGAGCASSGIDPEAACRLVRPEPSVPQQEPVAQPATVVDLPMSQDPTGTPDHGPQPPAAAAAVDPAGDRQSAGPARVETRSAGSSDVDCSVTASHRACRSADTRSVVSRERSGRQDEPSTAIRKSATGADVVLAARVITTGDPETSSSSGSTDAARVSTLALLVNAAVPILALLSLVATFVTRRRRQALRTSQPVAKHRRKQQLPTPSSRHR